MVDVVDLLQCPVCGTFYVPKTVPTGWVVLHCALPVNPGLSHAQPTDRTAIEVRVDKYRLTDVVGPWLAGSLLDIEV